MFSYGGSQLVWGSSRNGTSPYDLNLFIADWIDEPKAGVGQLHYPQETHLTNVRQLTFKGQNAEAYFRSVNTKTRLDPNDLCWVDFCSITVV